MSEKIVNWDLTDLYNNYKELDLDIDRLNKLTKKFNKEYLNKVANLHSELLGKAIEDYQAIIEGVGKVLSFVFLEFSVDDSNGSILNKYQVKVTTIEKEILFFELEFSKLDSKVQKKHIKTIEKFRYYLQNLKDQKRYILPLESEQILLQKDLTSTSAWSRLFDEYMGKIKFKIDGKSKSEEEVLTLLYHKDRDTRKKASKSLSKALNKHSHVLTYIFNMIKSDLEIETNLRGYDNKEHSRHLSNKISQKSVDNLIDTTLANSDIVSDYYDIKAKILGIKKLKDYDRYAPILGSTKKIPYEEAKVMVLEAFKNFDSEFYNIAQKAFDENWIDVYPKEAKRGGAFSHPTVTSAHPYVLLNYTESIRDVFTLAHELGHAIHQYMSRDVGYINFDTPLTTAETASIFAEMLLFDYLKDKIDTKELASVYASKLEDIFATLYRQVIFTTFERRVHSTKGELKSEDFSKIWMEENNKMFNNSVILTKNYSIWWSYIPHFIHSPFYCYAYSYGQLLVLALYGQYKNKDKDFIVNYKKFLASGGSSSPKELVGMFGLDIDDKEFWNLGIKSIKDLFGEFKNAVR